MKGLLPWVTPDVFTFHPDVLHSDAFGINKVLEGVSSPNDINKRLPPCACFITLNRGWKYNADVMAYRLEDVHLPQYIQDRLAKLMMLNHTCYVPGIGRTAAGSDGQIEGVWVELEVSDADT